MNVDPALFRALTADVVMTLAILALLVLDFSMLAWAVRFWYGGRRPTEIAIRERH